MDIELETPSYNERRYGKPWIAKITFVDKKPTYEFGSWVGKPGCPGLLILENVNAGQIIAKGQKDNRKANGSENNLYVVNDDGTRRLVDKLEAYKIWKSLTTQTSEAGWQAQSNEQEEWDYDHDLHTAWCNVAMGLATDYADAYCNHQCDDTQDHLPELGRTRRELKRHLFEQPASMGPEPKLYYELLYAVESKHPNETRHETALRHIRNAENSGDGAAKYTPKPGDE